MRNLTFVLALFPAVATAGMLDDAEKLAGQYIAEVGDLQRVTCPVYGDYDCLTWPRDLYRLNYGRCLKIHGYYSSFGETALLAVDQNKQISVFTIPSGMGGSIRQYSVTPYRCP